jgi:hypothetical protein
MHELKNKDNKIVESSTFSVQRIYTQKVQPSLLLFEKVVIKFKTY